MPSLIELADLVEIIAIADSSQARRSAARQLIGLPTCKIYSKYHDMLNNEPLDVADIALPHFLHQQVAVECANAGVDIIIEKPLATSLDEADRIIQAVNKANVQLAVIHNYTYRPPEAEGLKLIRSGAVGRSFLARFESIGTGHYLGAAGYDPDWRTRNEWAGGGALLDNACHWMYRSREFLGEPNGCLGAYCPYTDVA